MVMFSGYERYIKFKFKIGKGLKGHGNVRLRTSVSRCWVEDGLVLLMRLLLC